MNNNFYSNRPKRSKWEIRTIEIVIIGILIAMNIALSRVGISTPIVRITFAFLPIALLGILFGPLIAGTAAAFSDLLAFVLLGGVGGFFPGFTVSAFIGGVGYGFFLHRKNIHWWRIAAVVAFNTIFVNLTLNTIWILILTGNPLGVILPIRLAQNALTAVIHFVTIWFLATNPQLKNVYQKFSTAKK